MLIVEDSTVTVKHRTAVTALLIYFNLCLCVNLDILYSCSCSFTSISFLTNLLTQTVEVKINMIYTSNKSLSM